MLPSEALIHHTTVVESITDVGARYARLMTTGKKVLGLIQAGGQGSRMDVLTRERAKPALPYAGSYSLIDFALSAFAHSSIRDVWVSVQYQAGSLDPYLAGGRPWDLDRTRGGYRRVVAEQGGAPSEEGFSQGNADDLLTLRSQIEALDPELVVVMSVDHVFACDLDDVVQAHLDKGAECTLVVAEVSKTEARQQGVVTANSRGRVTGFEDKPTEPATTSVTTEIFVYDTSVLIGTLDEIRADTAAAGELDGGIGDFGDELLPRLVQRERWWLGRVRRWRSGRLRCRSSRRRGRSRTTPAGLRDPAGAPARVRPDPLRCPPGRRRS